MDSCNPSSLPTFSCLQVKPVYLGMFIFSIALPYQKEAYFMKNYFFSLHSACTLHTFFDHLIINLFIIFIKFGLHMLFFCKSSCIGKNLNYFVHRHGLNFLILKEILVGLLYFDKLYLDVIE